MAPHPSLFFWADLLDKSNPKITIPTRPTVELNRFFSCLRLLGQGRITYFVGQSVENDKKDTYQ